jgi:hypothetical protein
MAVGGAKTANPEALSPSDRVLVALTGVVVPRPTVGRLPADVGLVAASAVEVGAIVDALTTRVLPQIVSMTYFFWASSTS